MAETSPSGLHAAPVTPGQTAAGPDKNTGAPPPKKPDNEEPAMVLEADLPSDGRDEVGEAMIRNLPQRPELSEPPRQADASRPQP